MDDEETIRCTECGHVAEDDEVADDGLWVDGACPACGADDEGCP